MSRAKWIQLVITVVFNYIVHGTWSISSLLTFKWIYGWLVKSHGILILKINKTAKMQTQDTEAGCNETLLINSTCLNVM